VQFKNYTAGGFEFPERVTCVTGANGTGKTNLLDAVYYLCYTKSYFSAYQQSCMQHGSDGFRVSGVFEVVNGAERVVCKWRGGKKELLSNDVPIEKITDHIGKFSAVMIAPDDTELISGGSENRRRWVDSILCQVDANYLEQLLVYQRVLLQRNAWLKAEASKSSGNYSEIAYYDTVLGTCGAYIYEQRRIFFDRFLPLFVQLYRLISKGRELPDLRYIAHQATSSMEQCLRESLQQDLKLQRTTRGIHKDDIELIVDGMLAKQFASQGQKKSVLFSMKLAQHQYLTACLKSQPVLLLDDVFEKLDQGRMEALLSVINQDSFGQVLLTDTHTERVVSAFGVAANLGFIHLTASH
jgi:DNA replication and repair protein RecF